MEWEWDNFSTGLILKKILKQNKTLKARTVSKFRMINFSGNTNNYGGMDLYVLNIFCPVKQTIDDQSRLPFIDEVTVQSFVALLLS